MRKRMFSVALPCLLCLSVIPQAWAQFAVIDVGAIAQLLAQAQTLQAQLLTARDHLAQAQAEFASITGSRGMQQLLATTQRNYLPVSWADLQGAMNGSSSNAAFSSAVSSSVLANSILSPPQVAGFSPQLQQLLTARRQLLALDQNVTRLALQTTSARFASLQQLIGALASATDQKAVLDLQARIGSESVMLQNDASKLQSLYALMQAERNVDQQRQREMTIAAHGQFVARFQPTP